MGLVGSGSAEGLAGQTAPLGYFDPLGLSTGKTDGEIKVSGKKGVHFHQMNYWLISCINFQKYREAELKHGRVAMVAFLGILVGENFNPLFDGKITGPAIYQFQQADDLVSFFWVGVLFLIALVEGNNILNGWESSGEINSRNNKGGIAQLKVYYINGDLGFDPLGLTPADSDEFDVLRTKELNNGRLAMLGVAGIVAQELVNGKGVIENLSV